MSRKSIVLDANILIRAVLGHRVRDLIVENASHVDFFAPNAAYADARKYLPRLFERRGSSADAALLMLDSLEVVVHPLGADDYLALKESALERIAIRDADDRPILACAMAIECPVWTEDGDFFGAGVPTWTTDRVAIYLQTRARRDSEAALRELAVLTAEMGGYDL